MPKREDGFEEDTIRRNRKELRKTEDRIADTDSVVQQADRMLSSLRHEVVTNGWAVAIKREWQANRRAS